QTGEDREKEDRSTPPARQWNSIAVRLQRAELKSVGVPTFLPEFADSGSVRSRSRQFDRVALPANRRDLLRPSKDSRTTPLKHCRLRHSRSGLPGCTAPRLQFPA